MNEAKIRAWMEEEVLWENFPEFDTATALAETCADELGHPEWIDEETHVLWDIAVEIWSRENL